MGYFHNLLTGCSVAAGKVGTSLGSWVVGLGVILAGVGDGGVVRGPLVDL